MKKAIPFLIILIAGIGGIFYLFHNNEAQAPARESQNSQPATPNSSQPKLASTSLSGQLNINNSTTTPNYTPPGQGGETTGSDIQVSEVDYDGSKFTPAAINIKFDDWIFFENKSNSDFWPASGPNPINTGDPGFNSQQAIPPGGEYKFQFDGAGQWTYHDRLNPSATGIVNVSQ